MLACFVATLIAGMVNGNHWVSVLGSACAVAIIAWIIGRFIGAIFLRCINDHIDRHRMANPIPQDADTSDQDKHADSDRSMGRAAMG